MKWDAIACDEVVLVWIKFGQLERYGSSRSRGDRNWTISPHATMYKRSAYGRWKCNHLHRTMALPEMTAMRRAYGNRYQPLLHLGPGYDISQESFDRPLEGALLPHFSRRILAHARSSSGPGNQASLRSVEDGEKTYVFYRREALQALRRSGSASRERLLGRIRDLRAYETFRGWVIPKGFRREERTLEESDLCFPSLVFPMLCTTDVKPTTSRLSSGNSLYRLPRG